MIPAWRATSSLIWYRISQVKVACVSCVGLRLMTPGYLLAAWLRLVTSEPSVATEIRWLPTIAAEPILSGVTAQPVITSPTPLTMAAAVTSLRSTIVSLLGCSSSHAAGKSASTDRTTSPHQASSSVSRNG